MTKKTNLVLALLLIVLTGCVEKTGYYDSGEQRIIDNLTKNKSWEREYHTKLDNGEEFDVHEIWIFKDNGSGSFKNITTYENGKSNEVINYFRWSFTIPNFGVIYMDYGLFWEINLLTPSELHVYETYYDPITVPGQEYRDYQEYSAVPLN